MTLQGMKTKPIDGWSSKFSWENSKIPHKLPVLVEKPNINYGALKQLCLINGLGKRQQSSSKEAHETFMKSYPSIFYLGEDKLPELELKPPHLSITAGKLHNGSMQTIQGNSNQDVYIPHGHQKPHFCATYNVAISHDIRDHLATLHKQHITQSTEDLLKAKIISLRRLLKKLPFERKRSDQEAIFSHLRFFKELTDQIPLGVLKELSNVVQIEKWKDAGYTVFSGNEVNLILRGSVTPISTKSTMSHESFKDHFPSIVEIQDSDSLKKLVVGQCFGSLHKTEQRHPESSRICSVVTLEPCEFVKITSRDFEKMKQLVASKETTQKLRLVQSCRLFENWPKAALNKVVDLIGWKSFHPGQTLVNEGESCQVIGFINEGFCLLKRSIDVAKTHGDGTKGRRQKQVTIGKLSPGDSFGECTVLRDQPIPYSITTASHVQLGIISQKNFHDVDDVTKCLLSQCYEAIDNNMSQEDLQKQYIDQQKQNEWIKFKRSVIRDVILHRSILPGYGKWSRNPTTEDVAKFV